MPLEEEVPEGVEHETASQAVHTAERARSQAEHAPGQRSANQKAIETFGTTWVKKGLVKIQVMKIRFDVEMSWGHTRTTSENAVLQRMASLRTNPPCTLMLSYGEMKVPSLFWENVIIQELQCHLVRFPVILSVLCAIVISAQVPYCLGGAHILTTLQLLYREYCSNSRELVDWLNHVYSEEIKHQCPFAII